MDRFIDELLAGNVVRIPAQDKIKPIYHDKADKYYKGKVHYQAEYFLPGQTYETTMVELFDVYKKMHREYRMVIKWLERSYARW